VIAGRVLELQRKDRKEEDAKVAKRKINFQAAIPEKL
jgi:hypothetical protein